jgi:peptidoglycan/LPS O-acetylase OafA/YrhL
VDGHAAAAYERRVARALVNTVTALPEPDRGRIPELDGIRGTAILLVLVWHYLVCEVGAVPPLFRFLNQTWSGVDLFFVLSGFLIGGILLDHRDAPNYFKVFYVRRICRILPIYFAWLLLFVILNAVRYRLALGTASDWLFAGPLPLWSYATFTQNFLQAKYASWGPNWLAVTWSLAIEEQFYLLLPVVVHFIPVRRLPYVLLPFLAIAPAVRAFLYNPAIGSIQSYVLPVCKADALLLGVFCTWLVRREHARERIERAAPLLRILFLSCAGFVCLASYVPETRVTRVISDSLLAVCYASFILLALYTPLSPLARLARTRWLRKLGVIAYGTYLIHQGISGLVFGFVRGRWPYFTRGSDLFVAGAALAITLVIAAVSWRWFEKPIVDIGRRLNYASPTWRDRASGEMTPLVNH